MTFTHRLGNFFTIMGAALVGLFIISDLGDQPPAFGYFFFGLVGVLFGLYLRWRSPNQPPPPAGRFGAVKRIRQKGPSKPGFKLPSFRRSSPPPKKRSSDDEPSRSGSSSDYNSRSKRN